MPLEHRRTGYEKVPSALMIHRSDWLAEQRTINKRFDGMANEAWKQWRITWKELDEALRESYIDANFVASESLETRKLPAIVPYDCEAPRRKGSLTPPHTKQCKTQQM